jgi:hypothetical protein
MASQLCSERITVPVSSQIQTGTISLKAAAQPVAGRPAVAGSDSRQNVQVCVRLRPLSKLENVRGDTPVWEVDEGGNVCVAKHGSVSKYAFDTVHRESSTNEDVYKAVGAPVVQAAVQGINGTIFAYGVTSSGKTHTMIGLPDQPGLVPQALEHLFSLIEQTRNRFFLLRFSMIEIYNEVINDLLKPSSTNLRLREDPASNMVYVDGIKNVEVRPASTLPLLSSANYGISFFQCCPNSVGRDVLELHVMWPTTELGLALLALVRAGSGHDHAVCF